MTAQSLRRWLQPSPVLRWHPWAPLVALAAALAIAFGLGAYWQSWLAKRSDEFHVAGPAFATAMRLGVMSTKPARTRVTEGDEIDAAVLAWSRSERKDLWPAGYEREIGRERNSRAMRYLGDFRVTQLSGNAEQWRQTSTYCDEFKGGNFSVDLIARYTPAATAYSELLGRTIIPEQLAPAVPGFRCRT